MSVLPISFDDAATMARMVTLSQAVDGYLGELARQSKSLATRTAYRRLLNHLLDDAPGKHLPSELELADYERWLNRWTDASSSTLASHVSLARGFSRYLRDRGYVETDVAAVLKRPKRKRPEDLDVITVGREDVQRILGECRDWQELLTIGAALFLGNRRGALARIRRRDLDLERGLVRLLDKGRKVQVKPVPDEYLALLRHADAHGLWATGEDYLLPNRRPASVRRRERSDKIIWETVKRVSARAGVRAHVHALRAAFAVAYDEAHPDQVLALKELMGHSRLETTQVYLRRKDRAKAMESVRDLSWGVVLPPQAGEAHTGFEPVLLSDALIDRIRTRREALTDAATQRKLRS